MKRFAFITFILLLLAGQAWASAALNCVDLFNGSITSAATSYSSIYAVDGQAKAVKFIMTSTYNSGTATTLDVSIERCRANQGTTNCTASIPDNSFSQHGTTAFNTDGDQDLDIPHDIHLTGYVRAKFVAAGTSPNYTVRVEMCIGK